MHKKEILAVHSLTLEKLFNNHEMLKVEITNEFKDEVVTFLLLV